MERSGYVHIGRWKNGANCRNQMERKKVPGNQFSVVSKKNVQDFRLTLRVKQVPFAANAGYPIPFETAWNPAVMLLGYQADIGKGWWGALYHEHGRRILAKSKDTHGIKGQHLKVEQWNQV